MHSTFQHYELFITSGYRVSRYLLICYLNVSWFEYVLLLRTESHNQILEGNKKQGKVVMFEGPRYPETSKEGTHTW